MQNEWIRCPVCGKADSRNHEGNPLTETGNFKTKDNTAGQHPICTNLITLP